MATELVWTRGETAERLRMSPKTVSKMVKAGELTEVRHGRCVRITVRSVEELLGYKLPATAVRTTRKTRP